MTLRLNDGSGVAKRAVRMTLFDALGQPRIVARIRVNDASGQAQTFYLPSVSVSVTPQVVTAYGTKGFVTTGSARANAANGTPPYAYSWASLNNSGIVATSPLNDLTAFRGSVNFGPLNDVFRVTVVDAVGLIATADVIVSLERSGLDREVDAR